MATPVPLALLILGFNAGAMGLRAPGVVEGGQVKIMKINGGHQSSFGLFSCTEMGGNSFPVTSKYATSAPHDSIAKQQIALTPRRVSL
jgi:hypothetical protein